MIRSAPERRPAPAGGPVLPVTPLQPRRNLRDSVIASLRTAIVSGELVEGAVYSAPALGSALGVSATPVREAMMELAREGLVETVKNKGFKVIPMSEADLDELTEVRLLLEPPAVARLAGRLQPEDFPALRRLAEAIVDAADAADLTAYLAADRNFHARLLSFGGNRQLVTLATSLRNRTRMYGLRALNENHQLSGSAQEHHELLDLLQQGDSAGSLALMRRHIGHARDIWAGAGTQPQRKEGRG